MAERDAVQARRVLLVDDDRDFADSLAGLLRLEGYEVAVAYGFEEALEETARRPAAVALVDIRLGLRDGVELVGYLHRLEPELVMVMVTAYASIEATIGALKAGAYDFLRKPFHTGELLATLERCFERRRLRRERAQALAIATARNRELEALNARLAHALTSARAMAAADSAEAAGLALLAAVARDLGLDHAALYLRQGDGLRLRETTGPGYAPALPWPLPEAEAALALPLADAQGEPYGAVLGQVTAGRRLGRQDLELARILASFAVEVMRAAQAGEDLARSEERLRQIVRHSPSAIALADRAGRRLLANERFTTWFPEGVPEGGEALPEAGGRLLETEGPGGGRRFLVTRFPVLGGTQQPIGIGTIATDVTELHRAQERLRQAQRMEAIGQIAGGVAHDFNNLLAVVFGNLRLIEEGVQDRPELLELVEDALDAARSGVELTGRLLAFGRGQPLQPEPTDIAELALGFSRLLRRALGEGIAIELALEPGLWPVRVDRHQLEASLLNLAINARDAMPGGGQLRIAARNARFDASEPLPDPEARPGRYVALSVADTGCGMAPEVRERAIQPFFTTKPAGAGSGLGLSMAYGFVKQSGGHLEIASEPGRGTTVTLLFPAATGAAARAGATAPADAPAPTGRGERVLLVEDQPQVRLLVRRQLLRLGYEVVEAADAAEALASLAEAEGIAALLTDIVLPGGRDGVELAGVALAARPSLAVVFTTGYAATLAGHPGPLATAPVLRKPVEPDQLARALRAAIDRARPLPRAEPG